MSEKNYAVSWDACPPKYVGYHTHKFSIIDAFETAAKLQGATLNEITKMSFGSRVMPIIFQLPQFEAASNYSIYSLDVPTLMGKFRTLSDNFTVVTGSMEVFYDPTFGENDFTVSCGETTRLCTVVQIPPS